MYNSKKSVEFKHNDLKKITVERTGRGRNQLFTLIEDGAEKQTVMRFTRPQIEAKVIAYKQLLEERDDD